MGWINVVACREYFCSKESANFKKMSVSIRSVQLLHPCDTTYRPRCQAPRPIIEEICERTCQMEYWNLPAHLDCFQTDGREVATVVLMSAIVDYDLSLRSHILTQTRICNFVTESHCCHMLVSIFHVTAAYLSIYLSLFARRTSKERKIGRSCLSIFILHRRCYSTDLNEIWYFWSILKVM